MTGTMTPTRGAIASAAAATILALMLVLACCGVDADSDGGSWSEPPTIGMSVGETFIYTPETNLPSEITCSGTGMSWLSFDGTTLSGTVEDAGSYSVSIMAYWAADGLEQTTYQILHFDVSGAESDATVSMTYDAAAGWSIEKTGGTTYDADDSGTKPVGDDGPVSFMDEHGWLFIVFAVLAAILALVYVFFGVRTPYVLAGVILAAILAVVLFVYKDFGGIADALSGLFKD